jgi:hypothetical protein
MPAPRVIPTVVAIDPGKDLGWAFFADGVLFACGLAGEPRIEIFDGAEIVVCEEPQIYRRARARPDDLIKLTRIVGRCEELARACGATFNVVKPARWKGQVPKEICHRRLEAKLSKLERSVLEADAAGVPARKRHNVLDAIGIGMWRLGR